MARTGSQAGGQQMLRRLIAAALAAVVTLGIVVAVPEGAAAEVPSASFDWTMPERFGPDRNQDQLIDYVDGAHDKTPTGYQAAPMSWRVDLDACASSGGDGRTFRWRVIDQPEPLTGPAVSVIGGPECHTFQLNVPEEGAYRVGLQVTADGVTSAEVIREVVVQDFLIVSLGDSYGSGEGTPDQPVDLAKAREAEEKWKAYDEAVQALTTLNSQTEPFLYAVGEWDYAWWMHDTRCAELHAGDAESTQKCKDYWWSRAIYTHGPKVVDEALKLGLEIAIEAILDTVNVVKSWVDAAVATVEATLEAAQAILGQLEATWQDERCHRSAKAGSAKAAKRIEDEDPKTSVTFVHLACSGATMALGLLRPWAGTEPIGGVNDDQCLENPTNAFCIPPQVDQARQLIGDREVDAVYVSIGGNDMHFADIVAGCIVTEPCQTSNALTDSADTLCPGFSDLPTFPHFLRAVCDSFFDWLPDAFQTAGEYVTEGLDGDSTFPHNPRIIGLSKGYSDLNARMSEKLLPAQDSGRVFISEYVDAVKDDAGALCDYASMGLRSLPGLTGAESSYVDSNVVPALAGAIQDAASTHGWTFVDGIYSGFTNHGYCADDHYVVRLEETFLIEGRYQGMVHPNEKGHEVYANAIYNKVRPSLYPNGTARRADQAVFADAGPAGVITEGSSLALTNATWDSDDDPVTLSWSSAQAEVGVLSSTNDATPSFSGIDDGTSQLTLAATDEDGTRSDATTIAVTNVAPSVSEVQGLLTPIRIDTLAVAGVTFTDPGVSDTHSAVWDWGDGTTSPGAVTPTAGGGSVSGSHVYAAPGIYTVSVRVSDDDGGTTSIVYEYAVVYDPEGGFATGAGWLQSPAGAYTPGDSTDPDVVGRAHFAFVSKYQKGANVPTGNTSFRFSAADLDFASTSYEWMVISGSKVTYKGEGTVNGSGGYAFFLSAVDEAGGDKLRVKIWAKATGEVLYDNQAGETVTGTARTVIDAGQVSVKAP